MKEPLISFELRGAGWIFGTLAIGSEEWEFELSASAGNLHGLLDRLNYMIYGTAVDGWYMEENLYQEDEGCASNQDLWHFYFRGEPYDTALSIEDRGEEIAIKAYSNETESIVIDGICNKKEFMRDVIISCDEMIDQWGLVGSVMNFGIGGETVNLRNYFGLKAYLTETTLVSPFEKYKYKTDLATELELLQLRLQREV